MRGRTLRKIADTLNGKRVRTKHGRQWHASTIRSIGTRSIRRSSVTRVCAIVRHETRLKIP